MGVWNKIGPILFPTAADYHGGAFFSGTSNGTVLYDTNPQLIAANAEGKVFKMWFQGANDLFYAESSSGIAWTRRATSVLTNVGLARVFKDSGTYYLYGTTPPTTTTAVVDAYTSSDGITWTLQQAAALGHGTAGHFDDTSVQYLNPFLKIGATWTASYVGVGPGGGSKQGYATSTDLIHWTNGATGTTQGGWTVALTNTTFAAWGGIVEGDGGISMARWISTDSGATWGAPITAIPRTQILEGVGVATGSIVPIVMVQALGSVYGFYSATNREDVGANYLMMAAMAPGYTYATLTQTTEGINSDYVFSQMGKVLDSDSFQRANETPLSDGGKWTQQAGGNFAQNLVSNNAVATNVTFASRMIRTNGAVSWPVNQYSQATIGAGFTSTSVAGVNLWMVTAANSSVEFFVTPTTYTLRRIVASAVTVLYTFNNYSFAVGDVLRLEVNNANFSALKNGILVAVGNDNFLGSNPPGSTVGDTATPANAKLSAWSGGTIAPVISNFTGVTGAGLGAERQGGTISEGRREISY